MGQKDAILQLIETSISELNNQHEIAITCDLESNSINQINDLLLHFNKVFDIISDCNLSDNYLNQFQNEIRQTMSLFQIRKQNVDFNNPSSISLLKSKLESQSEKIGKQIELLTFNFEFFSKLGFFKNNIVAIGANGSGKTSLSNNLKQYLPKSGVVISAQKVLIIPTFSGISNFEHTYQKLSAAQTADKTLKTTYNTESNGNAYGILVQLGGELQVLLDNLLAERSSIRNKFCDSLNEGSKKFEVPQTTLDKTLSIWNSLIQHRVIECNDGINITLKGISIEPYPAYQMSDGEKVVLYLIAQVLQAPDSGFIIVDEPEMYLHKTILTKLWNVLEKERKDCIFIYLTHDLDFASSRTAKKVWIKSFNHPSTWNIEDIIGSDIPESLVLELLGSRKNILFCEGQKGSIDERIYNILFPEYTITPVDSCFSVINYTKTFNKIPNTSTKAYGLIDSDYHGIERLKALESENIFSFSVVEPENLFLDEEFLGVMSNQLLQNVDVVEYIKSEVISSLEKEIELQTSNFVSTKINYYFKDSHVSKGNTLTEIDNNFAKFTDLIKIKDWYNSRKEELQLIVSSRDYVKAISIFNNKGLRTIANKHLKISDFVDRSIRLLQYQSETHSILKKHFPSQIQNKNGL